MNYFNALIFAETADTATGNPIAGLLPFLVIGAAFYFLIIRPQRKRQADQKAMLRQVNVGDDIVTIGGFHGTILHLEEETMEVELAPGVVVTMARSALARTLTEPAPFSLDDDDDALGELDDLDDDDDDFGEGDVDDRDDVDLDFDDEDFDDVEFDDDVIDHEATGDDSSER